MSIEDESELSIHQVVDQIVLEEFIFYIQSLLENEPLPDVSSEKNEADILVQAASLVQVLDEQHRVFQHQVDQADPDQLEYEYEQLFAKFDILNQEVVGRWQILQQHLELRECALANQDISILYERTNATAQIISYNANMVNNPTFPLDTEMQKLLFVRIIDSYHTGIQLLEQIAHRLDTVMCKHLPCRRWVFKGEQRCKTCQRQVTEFGFKPL